MDPNSVIPLKAFGNALAVPGLRNRAVSLSVQDSSTALLRPPVLYTHTDQTTPIFLPFFLLFPSLFLLEHKQSLCQNLSTDITQSQGVTFIWRSVFPIHTAFVTQIPSIF